MVSSMMMADRNDLKMYATVLAYGAVAGMRSMTPAAILSFAARNNDGSLLSQSMIAKPEVATFLNYLAVGEIVADKLPFLPNRTSLFALLGRLCAAGFVGATIADAKRKPLPQFVAAGAVSALASTFVCFHTRKFLNKSLRIPDFAIALAEDAAVGAIAWWLLYGKSGQEYVVREI